MDRMTPDHYRGCLLGGAVGDALGAAVEFLSLGEIRARFGRAGVTDFQPAYGRTGAITDDTQMTAFTAEGLIRAWDRERDGGAWEPVAAVHEEYLAWLRGQGRRSGHPAFPEARSRLENVPAMCASRAPGGTCLSGLSSEVMGTVEAPLNDSKGCGGVMRVAPVGLAGREPFSLGCDLAALTHGHPSGYLASGFLAEMIRQILSGVDLGGAVAYAAELLRGYPEHEECLEQVDRAVDLARTAPPTAETVERLGEGWVAEEALGISLYCSLVTDDFREAVLLAVNHGGDSDSTGAITGNIMGALLGVEAIPEHWVAGVEAGEVMSDLAEGMFRRFAGGAGA